jgi:uncharacterized protein YrrD
MYRTTSVLALGLFLGLAPAGLNAQTQTQEPTAQQQTQQQDQQMQQDRQHAGLLATDEQSLLVDTMIGADVYTPDDESVGSIDDVVITVDGEVEGVVIGVGGWLGVGQRDVLVSLEHLTLETRDGEFRLVIQATREQLEGQPEFVRAGQRTGMMQQDTMQPGTTQQQTTQQQDQMQQQDRQALQQADQELQQANQAIQDGDAQQARQHLDQARQHLQQAYQQAQPEQQQALEDTNQQIQQAEQAVEQGDAQQAQQGVEQAREQLRMAMTDQDRMQQDQVGVQQDTMQQDTVARDRPRDGRIVFQDERSILASTMIGTNVYSETDEDMGSINDVIISMDGQVQGVVIGVGGFLGIGQKDVIIGMDRLNIQRTADDDVRVSVLDTREDLEAAEGFERPQQQQMQQ